MQRLNVVRQHLISAEQMSGTAKQQLQQEKEELLFDYEFIRGLAWEQKKASYKENIDYLRPDQNLVLRPLSIQDYDRGFLNTLAQLTEVGHVSREAFEKRFRAMKGCDDTYFVVVVEDTNKQQIVGSATLVREQKYIHQTATRGRVEDVVVSEECRGKQLGKLLVDVLILLGQKLGCYKISLECKDNNIKFYQSLGFKLDEQKFMSLRF